MSNRLAELSRMQVGWRLLDGRFGVIRICDREPIGAIVNLWLGQCPLLCTRLRVVDLLHGEARAPCCVHFQSFRHK